MHCSKQLLLVVGLSLACVSNVALSQLLKADELFPTGMATLRNKKQIRALAKEVKALGDYEMVEIVGHTDYRGQDKLNIKLSKKRAATIAKALIDEGVSAQKIKFEGVGSSSPVMGKAICQNKRGKNLDRCLLPDRRVSVEVKPGKTSVAAPANSTTPSR